MLPLDFGITFTGVDSNGEVEYVIRIGEMKINTLNEIV